MYRYCVEAKRWEQVQCSNTNIFRPEKARFRARESCDGKKQMDDVYNNANRKDVFLCQLVSPVVEWNCVDVIESAPGCSLDCDAAAATGATEAADTSLAGCSATTVIPPGLR